MSDGESNAAPAESSDAQNDRKRIVHVGNLRFETTEATLRETFAEFGTIVSVRIPASDRGRSKGFGFVQYETEEDANRAIAAMDGKELDGRTLKVDISQGGSSRRDSDRRGDGYGRDDRGYGRRDRGYDDRDRGYYDRDRGFYDRGDRRGYDDWDRRDGGRGRY